MSNMKKVPVKDISAEELAALNEWASKMREAQPKLAQMGRQARAVHKATVEAPRWSLAVTDMEALKAPVSQDPWSIGAPKVNHVSHIEGDPFESPDPGKEFE